MVSIIRRFLWSFSMFRQHDFAKLTFSLVSPTKLTNDDKPLSQKSGFYEVVLFDQPERHRIAVSRDTDSNVWQPISCS